ncbi:hypothetical protein HFC64_05335 [Saccharolobus solfataricus]|jgi:hypothetical protein|uniref:Uncharacterized protein n=1 Tax=Saccharolobus solfataricus TaxID=2287 RepID=A0A7S9NQQ5_SACSO|nr:hypothetical protein [Saccharolobus solfataricus]QPG49319.1 hypothetical protein HFC64_05335 [Saccharolobus solfataricus]
MDRRIKAIRATVSMKIALSHSLLALVNNYVKAIRFTLFWLKENVPNPNEKKVLGKVQTIELAKAISKTVTKIDDIQLGLDERKNVEKRKFYVLIGDNIEIGFYYNLYLPDGKRNGIVEMIPYYKQYK